ncbi:MAG TPA: flavin reductase family protein [Roseomonas sp.]|jgi:flavin reductase (DIM6/NTAB) family NADH-FMN oxidoreductase RutF
MKTYRKRDFPVSMIRRYLEPGPIVLVASAWKGAQNIMTMGWHMVMEFEPSRIGCFITAANHSYEMIRRSRACVINVPTADMAKTVAGIGSCTGAEVDKFARFGLTAEAADQVGAPLIAQCPVSLECRVTDTRLLRRYSLFILEVVQAHAAPRPKYPKTLHYTGDGVFMVAGPRIDLRRQFRPDML